MKSFYLLVALISGSFTCASQNYFWWNDITEAHTQLNWWVPNPEVTLEEMIDTTTWKSYFPEVYFDCLADSNAVAGTSQYVISADEFGRIQKLHVDSLLFSELQNMQMQIQELYAIVRNDYALERTIFYDIDGKEIDPATAMVSGNYIANVFLKGGKCVQVKYGRIE